MSTEYSFTRTALTGGGYDCDRHPQRTDHLATEIATDATFTGKIFRIDCVDTSMKITFDEALTGADQTSLNTLVSNHQTNV